jgi:4,5-DOPA dioxygenase extradiol
MVSLPSRAGPAGAIDLGRKLAPLADPAQGGALLLGSGGMVHNLGALDWSGRSAPPGWAVEFEQWARERLVEVDLGGLAEYRTRAPEAARAHPTAEHFLPLLFAAAAAAAAAAPAVSGPAGTAGPAANAVIGRVPTVRFPISGFELGWLSRTAVEFG